jgi:hypothetical protein
MSRPATGLGALSVSGSTPPTRAGAKTSACRTVRPISSCSGSKLCHSSWGAQVLCQYTADTQCNGIAGQQSSRGQSIVCPYSCTYQEDEGEVRGKLACFTVPIHIPVSVLSACFIPPAAAGKVASACAATISKLSTGYTSTAYPLKLGFVLSRGKQDHP